MEHKIDFDNKELRLITQTMRGVQTTNYSVYLDILMSILNKRYSPTSSLVTSEATKMIEGIQLKIAEYQFDLEMEKFLTEPDYGTTASTRLQSFKSLTMFELTQLHKRILDALLTKGHMSRRELAKETGIMLSSVCARVNELMEQGYIAVYDTAPCPLTNRKVEILKAIKAHQ